MAMNAQRWSSFVWALAALLGAAGCRDGRSSAPAAPRAPSYRVGPDLQAELGPRGVEVAPPDRAWIFRATPSRWGCEGALTDVAPARPEVEGGRATYRRDGFDEWYVAGARGVEQGFTLPAPPRCRARGAGAIVFELAGAEGATVSTTRDGAVLRDAAGREVLRYAELRVTDATGRELPAAIAAAGGRLSIRFSDEGAVYPVVVDPMIWNELAQLTATDLMLGDLFGRSVALSGDTAIVGAPGQFGSGFGAAYVFVRTGGTWSQEAKLTASDGAAGDLFGSAVALSADGNTAVVGAYGKSSSKGAAYVFVRSGSMWSQQQQLTAGSAAGDQFGSAVAVSGDGKVALVGAPAASGVGFGYWFTRSGTTWSSAQALPEINVPSGGRFGASVALSGDGQVALIGSPGRNGGQGAALVYTFASNLFSLQAELDATGGAANDQLGYAVALSADATTALAGAYRASSKGAAYVFTYANASWSQQAELDASDGVANDFFGISVALSGGTAIVGANGSLSGKGAAYVFSRSGATWSEKAKLIANNGMSTGLGVAVAVSGGTALAGAPSTAASEGIVDVFPDRVAGDACSAHEDCLTGMCIDGVCCTVMSCTALDECHVAGTCQPGTGVCSNPTQGDGMPCTGGTCEGGICTPPDAGTDGGTGGASSSSSGAGGASSSSSGVGGGSSSGMTGSGGATTTSSGMVGSGGAAGGSGGAGGGKTVDFSCDVGAGNGSAGAAFALLALLAVRPARRGRRSRA
jgi:hypothetical protein